jgi:hypothetical protein
VACRFYRWSITALIETSPTSCRRATRLHEGGAIFVSKGGGPVHLLCPARLDGEPILCDLNACLNRYQEGHLPYPQEAPCAHLLEAHVTHLPIDVEILHAAYPLLSCIVDIFADRPLNG